MKNNPILVIIIILGFFLQSYVTYSCNKNTLKEVENIKTQKEFQFNTKTYKNLFGHINGQIFYLHQAMIKNTNKEVFF